MTENIATTKISLVIKKYLFLCFVISDLDILWDFLKRIHDLNLEKFWHEDLEK